jgi:predicted RNase H-like HicB family nuclease
MIWVVKKYHEFEINYYQDEDGHFTAQVPAIPGCVASGKTLRQAYRSAIDAIESCLEARRKIGAMKFRKSRYTGLNIYRHAVNA